MNRDMNSASKASVNDPPLQPRSVEKSSWQTKGRLLNEEIRREWHYFSLPLRQTVCQAMPSVYLQIYVHIFSEDQAACGWEKYEKSYMASNSSLEVNRSEVKSACCESRMAERIHWWTERWLELCFLEWLQWSPGRSPHPQLLDVVWCTAAVVAVVA